jgi:hypothetical protein
VARVEYRNGRWYDGRGFVARTAWTDGPRFAAGPLPGAEMVDLDGAFVVPPYGDAHVHWLEPDLVDAYVAQHVRAGVLYVKDHATSAAFREAMRPALGPVELVSAHRGFTAPDAHPAGLVDGLVGLGVLPPSWGPARGDGELFHAVASEGDVDRAWPLLLATRPDFVKVFLVRSATYGRPAATRERGLDPALVPGIVARAHDAGLRVAAHVEDAHDVRVAVAAGVDDLAHLPFALDGDPAAFAIEEADALALGRRGGTVATTLEWLDESPAGLAVTRDNVARLRAAGVTLLVGSDVFRTTAVAEADRLVRHGLLAPAELLRAWCVDTPRAITRRPGVGALVPGAEASFLALRADPLADVAATGDIALRVRDGEPVAPADVPMPALPV